MIIPTIKDIDIGLTITKLQNMEYDGFLRDTGEMISQDIQMRMMAGVRPDGGIQQPNYEKVPGKGYKTWKEKKYPGTPPLILTGSLKNSIRETMQGDMVAINVGSGKHPRVGYRFEKSETFEEIAQKLEEGLPFAAFERPFLYMNEDEIEITFQRFCNLFSGELV